MSGATAHPHRNFCPASAGYNTLLSFGMKEFLGRIPVRAYMFAGLLARRLLVVVHSYRK